MGQLQKGCNNPKNNFLESNIIQIYTTGLWKWMGRVLCIDVWRMENWKMLVFFWIFCPSRTFTCWGYVQFFDICSVYLYPSINITRITHNPNLNVWLFAKVWLSRVVETPVSVLNSNLKDISMSQIWGLLPFMGIFGLLL